MKHIKTLAVSALLLIATVMTLEGQVPYKNAIGIKVGSMEAFTYKTFLKKDLALEVDFGFRFGNQYAYRYDGNPVKYYKNYPFWTFEVNPNLLYQAGIRQWGFGGLDWFVGGGLSLGGAQRMYEFKDYYTTSVTGKFGLNAMAGLELAFYEVPLAVALDFRPGYGMLFSSDFVGAYFDWAFCLGVRYTF